VCALPRCYCCVHAERARGSIQLSVSKVRCENQRLERDHEPPGQPELGAHLVDHALQHGRGHVRLAVKRHGLNHTLT